VLRSTFGSKGQQVRGGWKKLQNESSILFYTSSGISRLIKSGRWRYAECPVLSVTRKPAYKIVIRAPEGKELHGRRSVREDNVKRDLK
jgi:hypothetical protein